MRNQGKSVVIAPEGTRTITPKLGSFKKGPFHLAIQAGVPVVPVIIHNAGDVAPKGDFVFRPATVEVDVLPPLDTSAWSADTIEEHVAEVRRLFQATLGQAGEQAALPVVAERESSAEQAAIRPAALKKIRRKTKRPSKAAEAQAADPVETRYPGSESQTAPARSDGDLKKKARKKKRPARKATGKTAKKTIKKTAKKATRKTVEKTARKGPAAAATPTGKKVARKKPRRKKVLPRKPQ